MNLVATLQTYLRHALKLWYTKRPHRLWGPPSFLVKGYRDLQPRNKRLNFEVTIYLHPGPGKKMTPAKADVSDPDCKLWND